MRRLLLKWFLVMCLSISSFVGLYPAQVETVEQTKTRLQATASAVERLAMLVELVTRLRQEDPRKAVGYGEEALTLLGHYPDDKLKVTVLNGLCWAYGLMGQFREALDAGNRAESLALYINDARQAAVTLSSLANIYLNLSEYHKALDYSQRAETASRSIGYTKGTASALVSTARIQRHLEEYDKALLNYREAMTLSRELGNTADVGWILNNIGTVYWNKKQYQKALDVYNQGLETMKEIGSRMGQAFILNNLACVYSDLGKYRNALQNDLKALAMYEALGSKTNLAYTFRNIGRDYGNLGDYRRGLEFLNLSLDMAEKMGINDLKKTVYEEYCRLYENKGDFQQALAFHKKFKEMGDQLLGDHRNRRIADLQVIYDVDKKQKENLLLKKNNHIQTLELEHKDLALARQTMLGYFLILVVFLVLIIAVVTYNRFLIRKRAQQVLLESETKLKRMNDAKDKLFTIIAHDLGNPLNSLLLSSGHLKRNYARLAQQEQEEFIDNIYSHTQGLVDLLANLLQWALVQTRRIRHHPETVDIRLLTEETIRTIEDSARKKQIRLVPDILENSLAWADRDMMSAVIRNLVSNAVKYTNPGGEIQITSERGEDEIRVTVADNGVGIAEEQLRQLFGDELHESTRGTCNEKGTGLGLTLCKEFVETNGGKISVNSRAKQGSRFTITLPRPRTA